MPNQTSPFVVRIFGEDVEPPFEVVVVLPLPPNLPQEERDIPFEDRKTFRVDLEGFDALRSRRAGDASSEAWDELRLLAEGAREEDNCRVQLFSASPDELSDSSRVATCSLGIELDLPECYVGNPKLVVVVAIPNLALNSLARLRPLTALCARANAFLQFDPEAATPAGAIRSGRELIARAYDPAAPPPREA